MDCSSARLSSLVEDEKVEFDADIAGIGVLIAFLATSMISFATLIVAFVTLSVPSRLCTAADTVLSSQARRFFSIFRKRIPKLKGAKAVDNRSERIDAFMAFMVSISDQILVSQVAILIATCIIHVEITIYSVNIVIALGYLASTVHLASLPFCVDRLRDHEAAKPARIISMAVGSGMLVFLLIVQLSYTWDMQAHVYFTCVLHDFQMKEDYIMNSILELFVPISVLYGTYEIIQLLYTEQPPKDTPDQHLSMRTFDQILGPTLQRLEEQPTEWSREDLSSIQREAKLLHTILRLNHQDEPQSIPNPTSTSNILLDTLRQQADSSDIQLVTNSDAYARLHDCLFVSNSPKTKLRDIWREPREKKRKFLIIKWLSFEALGLLLSDPESDPRFKQQLYRIAEQWAFHQCRGSFIWRLLWLWLGNMYGIVTVFVSRSNRTGFSGNPDHWGFGQVVPLALLALPGFAAMGSYADYKRSVETTFTRVRQLPPFDPTLNARVHAASGHRPGLRNVEHPSHDNLQAQDYVKKVAEVLEKRAEDMGHKELYTWVKGEGLEESPSLQVAVICHATLIHCGVASDTVSSDIGQDLRPALDGQANNNKSNNPQLFEERNNKRSK
ncbi:hypothetical protein FGRMN_5870 [Fusarium graminum]|nr:hypothetical protein FGRMN_5870 [Fusarium graminum]